MDFKKLASASKYTDKLCRIGIVCDEKSRMSLLCIPRVKTGEGLPSVVVLCPVVHDELIVHEIEAIRLGFPWSTHQGLFPLIAEQWLCVNHLPGVPRVWHDERHGEVIACDELVPEVVTFNHPQVVHFIWSVGELQGGSDGSDVEEVWPKVVADETLSISAHTGWWWGRHVSLRQIKKAPFVAFIQGANLEVDERETVDVRILLA